MVKGFIIYPTYENIDGKTQVLLYGRLENGESFVTISNFKPYFFIHESAIKKVEKLAKNYKDKVKILDSDKAKLTDFQEEKVVKIVFNCQEDLNKFLKDINEEGINSFEADIKPHTRFIIDNNLLASLNIDGDYESSERVDRVYKNPDITATEQEDKNINLKILSIDIESDKDSGDLFCIGLYGDKLKKVFMISKEKLNNAINCRDEEECLEKFKQELIEYDPDIITGWNVIDFDLDFLKKKFEQHKVKFDLGRTTDNTRLRIEENFFKNSTVNIHGRLVLDGLNFIKDPFIQEAPSIKNTKFDNYTLEEVSQQLIGQSKLIKGKDRHNLITELYQTKQGKEKLAEYNLNDCLLVYEIVKKTKMLELAIERSQLTGMPLDKITSSIASFDSLYIREARKKGLVSPTTRFTEKQERIKGGFVMSPKPGLYKNILVLDFKSLYPSIIKTFNIDPASFLEQIEAKEAKNKDRYIEAPNKAYFRNQDGILPGIIEKLHQAREKAKQEKRELSSYAIKIIMNSFFGILASPNCRYFSLKMANAITNFGQEIIKLTASEIEKWGYGVIYSDTDSVFVHTNLNKEKSEKLGKEISEKIDNFYETYIKTNYHRKSYLDLEFDKLYLSLLMPQIRTHQTKQQERENLQNKNEEDREIEAKGAKKRYAGLIEEKDEKGKTKEVLDIVGLEAIRGDWTEAAQEFQKKLLLKIFNNENPREFIKEFIKNLRAGKLDKQLIYRKSIRKDLKEYTKITPPHVKAARKLDHLEGNIIEYYITSDGPEPLQNLKHKLDYEHYIDKQIKPIAQTVLDTLGISFEDILSGSRQRTLF